MKNLTVYTTAEKAFEFEVTADAAEKIVNTFRNGANFEMIDNSDTVPHDERRLVSFTNAHVVAIEVEG